MLPCSRPEVIGGKYIIQYLFAAGSTAAVVPLISSIGVGLTFTICKTFLDPLCHTDTNHLIPIKVWYLAY